MNYLPKEILAFLPSLEGQECQSPRPLVMGILNVTPDSFTDGGSYFSLSHAIAHAKRMVTEGADIIDIGGESTHPVSAVSTPSTPISVEEEYNRVIPVIKALKNEMDIALSVDTNKPEIMQAAIEAGADMINDVYALQKPGALEMMAKYNVPICLMHMQGDPVTMQNAPQYNNVIDEITAFFKERIAACEAMGIDRKRLILDPGFGFGKTVQHNAIITQQLRVFNELGLPLLYGGSRKASIGAILNKPEAERLYGSLAAAVLAVANGAAIVRVHDVGETVDALKVTNVILSATV